MGDDERHSERQGAAVFKNMKVAVGLAVLALVLSVWLIVSFAQTTTA